MSKTQTWYGSARAGGSCRVGPRSPRPRQFLPPYRARAAVHRGWRRIGGRGFNRTNPSGLRCSGSVSPGHASAAASLSSCGALPLACCFQLRLRHVQVMLCQRAMMSAFRDTLRRLSSFEVLQRKEAKTLCIQNSIVLGQLHVVAPESLCLSINVRPAAGVPRADRAWDFVLS